MRNSTFLLIFCILLCQIFTPLNARVGENKKDIEKRLNSRLNGAYKYSYEESLREALELPYNKIFWIQPSGTSNSFYFKRADKALTTRADVLNQRELYGWELHIAYLKDVSVMEFYQRYGDPMTFAEAVVLMDRMTHGRENAKWQKVEIKQYVPENSKLNEASDGLKSIVAILPRNNERYIEFKIPEDVLNSGNFDSTLLALILQDEKRATFENYSQILEEAKKYSDAKTSAGNASKTKGSTRAVSALEDIVSRKSVIPFVGTSVNFVLGGVPKKNRTKDVFVTGPIPLQADTAVGYNYELSDGSLRALVFDNGILFIDAKYDKDLRAYMETLYQNQEQDRIDGVVDSLDKF